jgi:DNA-binding beta-propeller fold protein YncE
LFVADTWNRRVSIFNSDGSFIDTFNVRGWYDELGNRPYLALDGERDMLYVTDPDGGRVLVYNTAGDCLGSFGQASDEIVRGDQFQTVGGIAIGSDGSVYVTDAGAGRLLKFPPFEAPALPETVDEAVDSAADVEGTAEVEPGAETTVDAVG